MTKELRSTHSKDVVRVTKHTHKRIMKFQNPVEDWKEFEKLIMTANEGKPIVGDIYYNWGMLKKLYPKWSNAIDRLAINHFNTIMEFDCLNEDGVLGRRVVLFQLTSWENV